jgi:hypothetical protein
MGVIMMSEKERLRKGIFEMVKQKCLTIRQAAKLSEFMKGILCKVV